MLSLRKNLSRPGHIFVTLTKLMRYILRYNLKYIVDKLWTIHCIKIIQ